MLFSLASVEAATLTLRWDPNPEPVMGYRVSWGTRSGQYASTIDVGPNTSFQFEEPIPPTSYYFIVRAYDARGTESEPSAEVSTGPSSLRVVHFSASLTAPQLAGTTITFQAAADGGPAPYEYKWLIFDGATWSAALPWSASNTFEWRPMVPNAGYQVGVWVRSSKSTKDAPDNADAQYIVPFAITGTSNTSLTISPSEVAPQPVRKVIKFTANVSGEGRYRYKWWVFDGLSWEIKREWSARNTFIWTPVSANPNYRILVRVENVANSMDTGGTSIPFPISSKKPGGPKISSQHWETGLR
jgi:hypothetical protein